MNSAIAADKASNLKLTMKVKSLTQKEAGRPVVAIVGRPNVGKSTLFNRLSLDKKAIVVDQPGTTRDRNYATAAWRGISFTIIDTGGFEPVSKSKILIQMREQTTLAIEEADAIIFLMDGPQGLTPSDVEVANLLRKINKPVFYAVNKIDDPKHETLSSDFYRLGVDELYLLSAQHGGIGVGDLMDAVVKSIAVTDTPVPDDKDGRIRIAVIGRPNVGKSSLVNKILGYNRLIVNPEPGTTRDVIDTYFELNERKYLLIDTAGIRRKSRISQKLEKYCVVEAMKTLQRCDIALLLIDVVDGITEQDAKIAGLAYERGAACIVVLNKWDLLTKDNATMGNWALKVKDELKFLDFAPILSVSAFTGQRVAKIFELIDCVYDEYTRHIATSKINGELDSIVRHLPPPRYRNRPNKINYATQIAIKPPTFLCFVRDPRGIHFSYERYLKNQLRERFRLDHVPVRLVFRRKNTSE